MTDREKLIDLLDMNCGYVDEMLAADLADLLIANGVTFEKDTNVGSKWISVEDRLPDKQHDWVLVICEFVPEGGYGVPHIAELRNGVWYTDNMDIPLEEAFVKVTHWMPMPEPPKEVER